MKETNTMRKEIKRRIKEIDNKLECLKELVDSEAFAPKELELTEFEESLRQVVVSALSGETPNGSGGTMSWAVALSDDDVRKLAPRLLELAKNEICKGCTVGLDQYWKGREDARKEAEKPITYHYPTYWPPCYHGGVCTNPMKDCINCPRTGGDIGISTTSGTCKKD